MTTEIFLTPCSKQGGNSRAYQHLLDTVVDGIEVDESQRPRANRDDEKVSVWGVTEGNSHLWERLEPGNYLLFYVGDGEYEYVAEVTGTINDPELAEDLWPDYEPGETGGNDPGDPWNYIIFLQSPVRVDIDSTEIHGFASHAIDYPQRFMPLNDQAHSEIRSRFEGIEEYLEARIPSHEDSHISEVESQTSGESKADTTSTSDRARTAPDTEEQASDLRPPHRTETTISRVVRNTALAKELKELYDHRCQVCGDQRKRSSADRYAEAHHIKPLGAGEPGPDTRENILILCPNHHSDFDYGMVKIDPETLTLTHEYDESISGKQLFLHGDHQLNSEYLEYHNAEIAEF